MFDLNKNLALNRDLVKKVIMVCKVLVLVVGLILLVNRVYSKKGPKVTKQVSSFIL